MNLLDLFRVPRRHKLTVKAHVARFFERDDAGDSVLGGPLYVFVKVTNLGRRPVVVTHIWFEPPDSRVRPVNVINPERRLPTRLAPQEQFETWLLAEPVITPWLLPGTSIDDYSVEDAVPWAFRNALSSGRVLLSNGATYSSTPNDTVPSAGFVAGPGSAPA
jgi:hypothetical protein